MSFGKIRRDPLDDVFSKLIRERADYACEHCGIQDDKSLMHCSHIIGRKWRGGRWWPDNAVCLHARCHAIFTDNPLEWTYFLERYLGKGHLDLLRERNNMRIKYTAADRKDMLIHYRSELKRLEGLRKSGAVGRLEFVAY